MSKEEKARAAAKSNELHKKVREAILRALQSEDCGYVAAIGGSVAHVDDEKVVLDGTFDLYSLASAAITAVALNAGRTP